MQISGLPSEMIIEIIKFSSNRLNLLLKLCLVCKEWNNLINSEEFYKFLYNSFFSWRNNNASLVNNNNTDLKTTTNSYQSLLKEEVKFWNSYNFHSQPKDFKVSKIIDNDNFQHFLRIKRLNTGDRRNIITKPIFYNTGSYYFEIKCLQWHNDGGDNVFVGFIFQPSNTINNYNTINFKSFLGCTTNKCSFGLYFPDGDIYGLSSKIDNYNENMKYLNQKITKNTKVGVYFDSNDMLVRFMLVKEKKYFPMLPLDIFLNEEQIESFKKKELVFYPAVSLLYARGKLELNATAGFKSIKKAKYVKEIVSQSTLSIDYGKVSI